MSLHQQNLCCLPVQSAANTCTFKNNVTMHYLEIQAEVQKLENSHCCLKNGSEFYKWVSEISMREYKWC
jgi:aminoglycoside N3'-acetyltransferase